MTGIVLHTPASLEKIDTALMAVAVEAEVDRPMSYDCFYGWGEGADFEGDCLPHMIIKCETVADAAAIAAQLIKYGEQVCASDADDWSQQPYDNVVPHLYLAEHGH